MAAPVIIARCAKVFNLGGIAGRDIFKFVKATRRSYLGLTEPKYLASRC